MTTSPPDAPMRTYRQRSPQVSGWLCLGIAALLVAMSAISWTGPHPSVTFVAWCCFGGALAWAVLLRPCVELFQEGVVMRNVFRDVHIPWTQVEDVGQRWNVRVLTPDDRGHSAWAIASQIERPRRSLLTGRGRDHDAFAGMEVPVEGRKVTASLVAEQIRQARAEYDVGREKGQLGPVGEGEVRKEWAWPAILPVLVTAVAVAVLSLT